MTLAFLFAASLLCAGSRVEINSTNFPDKNFRAWLNAQEFATDGVIEDITTITELQCGSQNIRDVTGIELFTNLKVLNCGDNQLTKLTINNHATLELVMCNDNPLTTINVSNNPALLTVLCTGTKLLAANLDNNPNLGVFIYTPSEPLKAKQVVLSRYGIIESRISNLQGATIADGVMTLIGDKATYDYKTYGDNTESFEIVYGLAGVEINSVNFPDERFRIFLNESDFSTDGRIDDIDLITSIDCSHNNITDLTGIELFTGLESLICNNNLLTELNLKDNEALSYLNCDFNQLIALDLYNNLELSTLSCQNNSRTISEPGEISTLDLDVSKCSNIEGGSVSSEHKCLVFDQGSTQILYTYKCDDKHLTAFNIYLKKDIEISETNFPDPTLRYAVKSKFDSDDDNFFDMYQAKELCIYNGGEIKDFKGLELLEELEIFVAQNCVFSKIDFSNNPMLKTVDINNCGLTELNIDKCVNLETLDLSYNNVTKLNLENNQHLKLLILYNNHLLSIDLHNNNELLNLNLGSQTSENVFPMTLADFGIDALKITNLTGGKLSDDKTQLLLNDGSTTVEYQYESGYGEEYMSVAITQSFKIETESIGNGQITLSTKADEDVIVSFETLPYEGYECKSVTITNLSDNSVITASDSKFTMPKADVKISAIFEEVKPTNISEIVASTKIWSDGSQIIVEGANGEYVEVYALNGKKQFSGIATDDYFTINVKSGAIYIVRTNNKSEKVLVK
ncbi:MAG: hypothetical protein HUJ96_00605 [Marinilabiliaceae bacterium]|nr:hypothetical protein [Marinilabiliaceae bacterium]